MAIYYYCNLVSKLSLYSKSLVQFFHKSIQILHIHLDSSENSSPNILSKGYHSAQHTLYIPVNTQHCPYHNLALITKDAALEETLVKQRVILTNDRLHRANIDTSHQTPKLISC